MPNREFRLMTFLYVDPISEIHSALEDLTLRCNNRSLRDENAVS